ncbi:MAG: DUF1512 family protein [Candidatus Aenigmarchaeota archaeon]|nr:DUF1512 family protein [Candidatus Aenigmarchaeota archaeon]
MNNLLRGAYFMNQLQADIFGIFWIFLFFFMLFFYPRLLLYQLLDRFYKTSQLLDTLNQMGRKKILSKINGREEEENEIKRFLNFFLIPPVSLDPFGIIKKLEHLINQEEERFRNFASKVAKNLNEEEKWNFISALSAQIALHNFSKIVKHYIQLIEKTKSYQLGFIIQMQLPFIEKYSKAIYKAVEAFVSNHPIGDSVGPLLAASMMKNVAKEIDNSVYSIEKLKGKKVIVVKAKGPGARVGRLGRVVEILAKKFKVEKIITVDAALKLESEKTGEIAEGIGVAIGGIGVEKAIIEEVATKNKIKLDSYVIKMSAEEALYSMKEEILNAAFEVKKMIEKNIEESKEKVIMVVGVGNTCGIPNNNNLDEVIKVIKRGSREIKKWEEEERKREKSLWNFGI